MHIWEIFYSYGHICLMLATRFIWTWARFYLDHDVKHVCLSKNLWLLIALWIYDSIILTFLSIMRTKWLDAIWKWMKSKYLTALAIRTSCSFEFYVKLSTNSFHLDDWNESYCLQNKSTKYKIKKVYWLRIYCSVKTVW